MMKSKRKLLFVGGTVVTIVAALAHGAPVNTVLLIGAVLLCPAAMLFGMRVTGDHQCGRVGSEIV